MARDGTLRRAQHIGSAAGIVLIASAALLARAAAVTPRTAQHTVQTAPLELSIASPRPYFMQLSGLGPAFEGTRVVWTAIDPGQQAGSRADRIYCYDLQTRRLSVPVRSEYGKTGFIGGYALAGGQLAYVDTGLTPGGPLSWRVDIFDFRTHDRETIASSDGAEGSQIAPQIAYDGTHLLVLQTMDDGAAGHDSLATLYTPSQHRRQLLGRAANGLFGDPALARDAALWTVVAYGPRPSSHLALYDLRHQTLHTEAVGNVSQLAASGDYVVWKTGMSGINGRIALYSVRANRLVAADLAHGDRAVYPTINGHTVAWTFDDGSAIQVYSLGSGRVIYTSPTIHNRFYGLTAVADHAISWAYTVIATGKSGAHGYVVVHQMR